MWANAAAISAQSKTHAILALRGLSLQVRAGEIVGIAGVDGNGQRELADAIAGLIPIQKGTIEIGSEADRKSTRLNSSHSQQTRMPSSA